MVLLGKQCQDKCNSNPYLSLTPRSEDFFLSVQLCVCACFYVKKLSRAVRLREWNLAFQLYKDFLIWCQFIRQELHCPQAAVKFLPIVMSRQRDNRRTKLCCTTNREQMPLPTEDLCSTLKHYLFQLCNYRSNLIDLVNVVLSHSTSYNTQYRQHNVRSLEWPSCRRLQAGYMYGTGPVIHLFRKFHLLPAYKTT